MATVETRMMFTSTCKQWHAISFLKKTHTSTLCLELFVWLFFFLRVCFCGRTKWNGEGRGGWLTATVDGVKNSKMERKRDCSPESEVSYSARSWQRLLSRLNGPIVWIRPPWHRPFHYRMSPGTGSRWWLQCKPPPPPPLPCQRAPFSPPRGYLHEEEDSHRGDALSKTNRHPPSQRQTDGICLSLKRLR